MGFDPSAGPSGHSGAGRSGGNDEPSVVLPIIALVSFVVCWPLGVILSIVALVKTKDASGSTAKTLSIVAVVLNLVFAIPMVGIMAAIAIPNFVVFQCRSKQSEAKTNLRAMYVAQESFRGEHDSYSDDKEAIGFTPRGQTLRYEYEIVESSESRFTAKAVGVRDNVTGDIWVIDQDNNLRSENNACR